MAVKVLKQMEAKPLPLFRVDSYQYKSGDTILPKGTYQAGMDEARQRIEESLARTNTLESGVQRKDCVFLFDDLKNALLFFKNKTEKANLYKVIIDSHDFVYKGDMNYLDFLLEVVHNTRGEDDKLILDAYAKKYWKVGFGCASPCYELLFKKATVEELVIAASSVEAQHFYLEIKTNLYVHITDTYKALVEKYY